MIGRPLAAGRSIARVQKFGALRGTLPQRVFLAAQQDALGATITR
jgi:hypothetical protein